MSLSPKLYIKTSPIFLSSWANSIIYFFPCSPYILIADDTYIKLSYLLSDSLINYFISCKVNKLWPLLLIVDNIFYLNSLRSSDNLNLDGINIEFKNSWWV